MIRCGNPRLGVVLSLFLALLALGGCAGGMLKKDMVENKHYSETDADAIIAQFDEYRRPLNQSRGPQEFQIHFDKYRKIACTCFKKYGDKCRSNPHDAAADSKDLVIKTQAIDFVNRSMDQWQEKGKYYIDPAECGT